MKSVGIVIILGIGFFGAPAHAVRDDFRTIRLTIETSTDLSSFSANDIWCIEIGHRRMLLGKVNLESYVPDPATGLNQLTWTFEIELSKRRVDFVDGFYVNSNGVVTQLQDLTHDHPVVLSARPNPNHQPGTNTFPPRDPACY